MRSPDLMLLEDIVRDRKVAIFLNEDCDLVQAIKAAGSSIVASYHKPRRQIDFTSDLISLPYATLDDVGRNNAEVLFLDGTSVFSIGRKDFRHIGHATFVLFPANFLALLSTHILLQHIRRKRLAFSGSLWLPRKRGSKRWIAFRNVNKRHKVGPQFFFSLGQNAQSFFRGINDLKYCVLSESRPAFQKTDSSEDLKILVHNDDVDELVQRLTRAFGSTPIEIYTPLSVPGHTLSNHVSYLPPARALDVVARSIENEFGQKIPNPRDALLAHSYHLLFHEMPIHLGPQGQIHSTTWKSSFCYRKLMRLCDEADVSRLATLEEMEALLRREGWFPSMETLTFIARDNRFVQQRYIGSLHYKPGLAVFVIRELAEKHGLVREIQAMIESSGFDILKSGPIPAEMRSVVMAQFRGGNWTLPIGAGPPVHFIIAFDRNPTLVNRKLFVDALSTDNGRLIVKREIRKRAASIANAKSFNPLHSSDNSHGALEYIEILSPDMYEACEDLVRTKK